MKYSVIRRAFRTLKDTDQGLTVKRKEMSWREYKVFQILQPYYQQAKQGGNQAQENLRNKL